MTHEQFTYWLKGFLSVTHCLDADQVDLIKEEIEKITEPVQYIPTTWPQYPYSSKDIYIGDFPNNDSTAGPCFGSIDVFNSNDITAIGKEAYEDIISRT